MKWLKITKGYWWDDVAGCFWYLICFQTPSKSTSSTKLKMMYVADWPTYLKIMKNELNYDVSIRR